jgi:hypothetical protein
MLAGNIRLAFGGTNQIVGVLAFPTHFPSPGFPSGQLTLKRKSASRSLFAKTTQIVASDDALLQPSMNALPSFRMACHDPWCSLFLHVTSCEQAARAGTY